MFGDVGVKRVRGDVILAFCDFEVVLRHAEMIVVFHVADWAITLVDINIWAIVKRE